MTPPQDGLAGSWFERSLAWLLAAFFALISISYLPAGQDVFRLPKLLLLRTEGIVLITFAIVAFALRKGDLSPLFKRSSPLPIAAAFLAWGSIAAICSDAPSEAALSILSAASGIAVCLAAYLAAPAIQVRHLHLITFVAAVQSAMVLFQNSGIWFPFILSFRKGAITDPTILRVSPIAFLGNRNDVGMFLVPPVILLLGIFATRRKLTRGEAIGGGLVLLGLLGSHTMTAILGVAITAILMVLIHFRQWSKQIVIVATIVVTLIVALSPALRARVGRVREAVTTRDYDLLLTDRMAAFMAASSMILEDPLTGGGPGSYGRNYFDHKIAAGERWPSIKMRSQQNFADAHNDHLQVAAEYGLPGYALLVLAAIWFVRARKGEIINGAADERTTLARVVSVPLLASLAILALAQFPLQTAATGGLIALIVGTLWRWSELR